MTWRSSLFLPSDPCVPVAAGGGLCFDSHVSRNPRGRRAGRTLLPPPRTRAARERAVFHANQNRNMTIAKRLVVLLAVPRGAGWARGVHLPATPADRGPQPLCGRIADRGARHPGESLPGLRRASREHPQPLLATTGAQREAARARFDEDERDVNRLHAGVRRWSGPRRPGPADAQRIPAAQPRLRRPRESRRCAGRG